MTLARAGMRLAAMLALGTMVQANFTAPTNDSSVDGEVAGRFYGGPFDARPRNSCLTARRQPGRCVPLQSCPELRDLARQYSPLYLLQAVSDYTCGFSQSGVQVCCPEEKSAALQSPRPEPLQNSWNQPRPPPSYGNRPSGQFNPSADWPPSGRTEAPWSRPPSGNNWPPSGRTDAPWSRPTPDNRPRPTNGFRTSTEDVRWPAVTEATRPTRQPVTSTPATRRPPRIDRPITATPPSSPGGKTSHKNRRLLPESDCGVEVANKILGGTKTELEEFPWMALLRLRYASGRTAYICGGSLISSRYVLTAAHCIRNSQIPSSARIDQVRLGEFDQDQELDCNNNSDTARRECSPPTDDIDVEERIIHPKYGMKDPSQKNDIALLRLKRPAKLSSYVQPICLPLDEVALIDYDDSKMWTAGWGKTFNGPTAPSSAVKLKVELPVVSLEPCGDRYKSLNMLVGDTQICAGGEEGKDSCQGDSGGPLMSQDLVRSEVRWHVQGIVSIGPEKCGMAGSPGIYTRVSKYLPWILDSLRE